MTRSAPTTLTSSSCKKFGMLWCIKGAMEATPALLTRPKRVWPLNNILTCKARIGCRFWKLA